MYVFALSSVVDEPKRNLIAVAQVTCTAVESLIILLDKWVEHYV